jgi:undecaprenyl-diphosphatase
VRIGSRIPSAWVALATCTLLLFLIDLVAVESGSTRVPDRSFELQARTDLGHGSLPLFQALSFVGGASFRLPLLIVLAGLLLWRRHSFLATLLVAAAAGSGLLNEIVKIVVARSRPHLFAGAEHAAGYSFPSGHAMDAIVFFGTLAYVAIKLTGRRDVAIVASLLAVILAGLIGLSRVVLGVHYPSDVVGGWLLGAAWLGAIIAGFRQWAVRIAP